ncbi:MAG: histidinol-phosphate transaminase [Anaerolineaceae bacterium]|nr:histidinol-phosphate transaminase [Anaerolineaceae bacterium]
MIDINKIARQCIREFKEYVPGKPVEEVQRELGIQDVLKLSSNESPLGASPLAVQAMIKELKENCHFYPESLCPVLAAKLAQIHKLDPEQFFINNGVDGVLSMIGIAIIDCGDEVVTSQYTFQAYQNVTTRMGGNIVLVPQTADHRFDIDGIIARLTPQTKIVFLCNPNNPTGTMTTRAEFERLLAAVPENTLLVSDEAYYDFAEDPDYPQTIPYLKNHTNLVITRTFSKVMGLAGLRVGYAMAHPEIIKVLRKVTDPFPVNRIAQAGALAGLDDLEFLRCSIQIVQQGRQQVYDGLLKMGLDPIPSQANFVCVDLGMPATPIYERMLRMGVIVRPLAPQGLPTFLRFTVGTPDQNIRALNTLAKALDN